MFSTVAIQKLLSLTMTLGLITAIGISSAPWLVIALGQGHFLTAYWYKYTQQPALLQRQVPILTFLFIGLYAAVYNLKLFDALECITAILFTLHFLRDEVTLNGQHHTCMRLLERLPLAIFCSGIFASQIFYFQEQYHVLLALGSSIVYFSYAIYINYKPDTTSAYFLTPAAILLLCFLSEVTIPRGLLFSLIVLFHYFNWYFFYSQKLRPDPQKHICYLRTILVINTVIIGLFVLFKTIQTSEPVLSLFFTPANFWIWTLLHLASSTRWLSATPTSVTT